MIHNFVVHFTGEEQHFLISTALVVELGDRRSYTCIYMRSEFRESQMRVQHFFSSSDKTTKKNIQKSASIEILAIHDALIMNFI